MQPPLVVAWDRFVFEAERSLAVRRAPVGTGWQVVARIDPDARSLEWVRAHRFPRAQLGEVGAEQGRREVRGAVSAAEEQGGEWAIAAGRVVFVLPPNVATRQAAEAATAADDAVECRACAPCWAE